MERPSRPRETITARSKFAASSPSSTGPDNRPASSSTVPRPTSPKGVATVARQALDTLAAGHTRQTGEANRFKWYGSTYRSESGDDVAFVFTDSSGHPVKPDAVRRLLNRYRNAAGLGDINPHRLRHSAASVLIERGESPTAIAAQLGHASPAITMSVYAHALKGTRERTGTALGTAGFGEEATG